MACTFHIQLHDKILWVSYCQKIVSILRSSLILTSNEDNFASPMGTFDCRFEMGKTCGQMRFRRANTLALDCKIGDAIFGLQYKGKSSHLLKCSCTEEGNWHTSSIKGDNHKWNAEKELQKLLTSHVQPAHVGLLQIATSISGTEHHWLQKQG